MKSPAGNSVSCACRRGAVCADWCAIARDDPSPAWSCGRSFRPAGATAPPPAQSAVSDEAGGFSFDGWPSGEVWLAAKAPDGSASHIGPLTIGPGATAAVELVLTPAAWIAGRALAPDGRRRHTCRSMPCRLGSLAAGTLAAASFTDEAGWFRVGPLPPGRVGVQLGLRRPASAVRSLTRAAQPRGHAGAGARAGRYRAHRATARWSPDRVA